MKKALTIAGSDSSGGAGIQADLKTFSALGVYGMSVITAVTAQNTQGVLSAENISPDLIGRQLEAILSDIPVDAVKIGMVSDENSINSIADVLSRYRPPNIVLDTVMVSKNGFRLLDREAVNAFISRLMPLSTIVTPNIPEAEVLTGLAIETPFDMERAASKMLKMGSEGVLVKGGHLKGDSTDVLISATGIARFPAKRIKTKNTHGTGCTLSSAIASFLAKGCSMDESVGKAKSYITTAIAHSFAIGKGIGPTNHFHELYERAGMQNE